MHTAETIIVGAGAAGSVIAARMTENDAREVLLLESGPDYPNPDLLPKDLANGHVNSLVRHDWKLKHQPTTQAFGQFPFPRGRVVGGSSAVNTCIALRGGPQDYDEWADQGLKEWSWAHCLPAFKRLEHDHDFNDEWHGQQGPLPIRRHPPEELTEWQQAFLEACADTGYAACADSNNPANRLRTACDESNKWATHQRSGGVVNTRRTGPAWAHDSRAYVRTSRAL